MDETPLVTCFLRHRSDDLLLRRNDEVGSDAGAWGAVAGRAEGDPDAAAREEIREKTGLDPDADVTLVRTGDAFPVAAPDLGVRWIVHPSLFDASRREIEPNRETADREWVPPTAILRRKTVPDLWSSYDRVRPTVGTITDDRTHGSAWLSVRALEVLRDESALAASDEQVGDGWSGLTELATALVDARPSMPVVRNRVDRAMAAAIRDAQAEQSPADGVASTPPAAIETAAERTVDRALRADAAAGAAAADRIDGARVATVSRSGTVRDALTEGDPEAVLVATSHPGGEGVAVATSLADEGLDVTLTSDAALAFELHRWDADVLLVGADGVLPEGHVVNKAGTRGAAAAAAYEGIEVVVAAATDTVDPTRSDPADVDLDAGSMGRLADRETDPPEANPTFDVTPPALVDEIATEDGPRSTGDASELAAAHAARAGWRRADRA